MSDIDLVKLKKLALNVKELRGITNSRNDKEAVIEFESEMKPDVLIAMIEQLEAAQRERDNYLHSSTVYSDRAFKAEAELKRRDAQEPVAWISERNLKNLGKQFSVYVKHEPVMVRPVLVSHRLHNYLLAN